MTYFTGDIHGNPSKIRAFCKRKELTAKDTIVILGDVGANYFGDARMALVQLLMMAESRPDGVWEGD